MTSLTHLDEQGNTRMVNVADKAVTKRQAVAAGRVVFPEAIFETLMQTQGMTKKGSILEVAKVAGIMAAKNTADLIPMCHPMMLEQCDLNLFFNPDRNSIEIEATVGVTHKTGVEMEALTAVSVAALTVYDMTKALSHEIVIQNVLLRSKTGGRSGTWQREGFAVSGVQTANEEGAAAEGAQVGGEKAPKPRRTEAASKAAQELSQNALNTINGALERFSGVVTEVKSKVHTTMSQLREKTAAEEAAAKKAKATEQEDEIQKTPLDTAPDAPVSRVSLLRKRKAAAKSDADGEQPIDEITVNVLYFAELQVASKKETEPVTLAASATPKDLYTLLKARYHFEREQESLLVSINEAFAQWDTRLKEGDKVAFIPPISGG